MDKKEMILDLLATALGFVALSAVVFIMLLMGGAP